MKITVVFSLHFLFLLNNSPALSYTLISVGWFFLKFFKEPVGSSSSKIPESKKHGFQFFKDTRIKEFQNQRNMGSSSSTIPGSKKHRFQFFEQRSDLKNHCQFWVFQKLENRWVFMKELAKNRQFFGGFFHSFTFLRTMVLYIKIECLVFGGLVGKWVCAWVIPGGYMCLILRTTQHWY
jgi:hypothetical protein